MAVFFVFAMLLGAALQITNAFGGAFLDDFKTGYPGAFGSWPGIFGMNVVAWGRESTLEKARKDGYAAAASREAFFADSDVVSLHLRLIPETRGIVTAADLARMKTTALLVNTSRAPLSRIDRATSDFSRSDNGLNREGRDPAICRRGNRWRRLRLNADKTAGRLP